MDGWTVHCIFSFDGIIGCGMGVKFEIRSDSKRKITFGGFFFVIMFLFKKKFRVLCQGFGNYCYVLTRGSGWFWLPCEL